MLGRRLLVLFAVLLGLTALVTSLAPRPTITRPGLAQPTATPVPTETPAPATASSRRIEKTISADAGHGRACIRARVGDVLALTVKGDVLDGVEIEDAGKLEPIEPGSPARFEFLAESPGEHDIVLLDADRRVGILDIRAAPGR